MGTFISTLEKTRQQVRQLLYFHLRLCIWVLAGSIGFLVPGSFITKFLNEPESYLRLNSQFFNQQELQSQAPDYPQSVKPNANRETKSMTASSLPVFLERAEHTPNELPPIDPDWDGALAGLSIGATLAMLFTTPSAIFTLPLLGGIAGYQLDQKIH